MLSSQQQSQIDKQIAAHQHDRYKVDVHLNLDIKLKKDLDQK